MNGILLSMSISKAHTYAHEPYCLRPSEVILHIPRPSDSTRPSLAISPLTTSALTCHLGGLPFNISKSSGLSLDSSSLKTSRRTFFPSVYSPSENYVDGGGTFRSPGEGFEDGAGIFRSVGDDYIDYSGVLRSPGEDFIDNSGTLRSPGEGFIDGNGIYRGG